MTARMERSPDPVRHCECGQPLKRRDNETNHDWVRRRYCSVICGRRYSIGRWYGKRPRE